MSVFNLSGQRRRIIRENIIAYLFLTPALTLIMTFGILPVAFALFVSLHRWRRFPEEFIGLDNYQRALGDFAYVVFIWIAAGAAAYAGVTLWRFIKQNRGQPARYLYLIPGVAAAGAAALIVNWVVIWLPIVLDIPQRLRAQARSGELFIGELIASFQTPQVVEAGNWMLLGIFAAVILAGLCFWAIKSDRPEKLLTQAASAFFLLIIATFTLQLTVSEVFLAIETAREAGNELPIWTQAAIISAGVIMLGTAYLLWRSANRGGNLRFVLQFAAASMLMVGGYAFVGELPMLLSGSDDDLLRGFNITLMYTLGTVPVQLMFGLLLAYLLFQKIKFQSFFRMVYFLPYVTPFVATSIVFGILFSHRATSPVNQLLTTLGIPVQKWLLEPTGIFKLIFGPQVPDVLSGPSLALVVIIIYSSWTYIGYSTVLFLAGLGNISGELYEAARIDGANEWNVFRRITLPMLSPTTFFLTLITIIGTLQSFTQIWILRTPAASSSVDTVGVYIYETISQSTPNMGYGSALSLVLFTVILIFTLVQNRISRDRVFYG
ncbi:MAG: sugar ABC transporter permease [Anaerolineae bacterium]|nr:sugar ABC transporter permease [Anaerolineae bacterium]